MISLRKLINTNPDTADSMLRTAQALLEGIGLHAIRCDQDAYLQFRQTMAKAASALEECSDGVEASAAAEEAIQALEMYNRRIAGQLRVRSNELQEIVKMLAATIGEISMAGEENVNRLRRIEGQVSSATQVEDVRAVKAQLSLCLYEIRKEADRQKSAANSTVERLTSDLGRAQAAPAAASGCDPVTGLPMRAQAIELISSACESDLPALAAVMAIERLQAVNTAFGPEVGDQLLRYFSGYLRQNLPPGDHLFRWSGPALLAFIIRPKGNANVHGEIEQLMTQKLEFTARTATRSVRVPVSARWALFSMMPSSRLLIQKIDAFAAMQPAASK